MDDRLSIARRRLAAPRAVINSIINSCYVSSDSRVPASFFRAVINDRRGDTLSHSRFTTMLTFPEHPARLALDERAEKCQTDLSKNAGSQA